LELKPDSEKDCIWVGQLGKGKKGCQEGLSQRKRDQGNCPKGKGKKKNRDGRGGGHGRH